LKANRHSGATQQSFSGQTVTLDYFHSAPGFAGPDALAKLVLMHLMPALAHGQTSAVFSASGGAFAVEQLPKTLA
jgi:hypothetical protein